MKVYKTRGCDKLSQWHLDRLKQALPEIDWFVYHYENHGYEGNGVAVWQQDGKYGYTQMGHCSCYGPLDDLNSIMYSWDDMLKLLEGENRFYVKTALFKKRLKEVRARWYGIPNEPESVSLVDLLEQGEKQE